MAPKISVILSLYRAERFMRRYFESMLEQSALDSVELSIVHNDPTEGERALIDEFATRIRMIRCEVPRESLYASWNRAIAQSSGEYLVCWNVDDLRTKNSLAFMANTLDKDSLVGWTYGDFVISKVFGETQGVLIKSPEWSRELGTRGAIGGPFFMWRRNLIPLMGWFDEQFRSGGDFDYTVRLSLASKAVRTPATLGYFLDERSGLSTLGELQAIERTAIQLRYGIYETLDWHFVPLALYFRITYLLQPGNSWVSIERDIVDYENLIASRRPYAWKIPFHTIKAFLRRYIAKYMIN
jgi:glycosyltransferase involved in cell wall biosynthesis